MILKNNLYTINDSQCESSTLVYDLSLCPECVIYRAHFPSEPITPGVCIIQMAKELLEDHFQRPLAVKLVKNVKFLAVLSPRQHSQVRFAFTQIQEAPEGGVKAIADVTAAGTPVTHISFTCQ